MGNGAKIFWNVYFDCNLFVNWLNKNKRARKRNNTTF